MAKRMIMKGSMIG